MSTEVGSVAVGSMGSAYGATACKESWRAVTRLWVGRMERDAMTEANLWLSIFLIIALVAVVLGLWSSRHRNDTAIALLPSQRIERQLSILTWLLVGNIVLTVIAAVAR